ncbi:MAG: hypothetical protein ACK5SY_00065 [bacterium]|jgi:hypothetical protein|uniref:Uncharacterized protein n=1 Tax=Bacteriophage sp. TaxID=38018 RepID=A0A7G9A466_9VIRU|nr:MAG: hypothetical protein [Bacteriophage sp.]
MNQKIDYYARNPQISLMSDKLTNVVGNTVFPFSDKEEQLKFFSQMLEELLAISSVPKYTPEGIALNTIKALLSELD